MDACTLFRMHKGGLTAQISPFPPASVSMFCACSFAVFLIEICVWHITTRLFANVHRAVFLSKKYSDLSGRMVSGFFSCGGA